MVRCGSKNGRPKDMSFEEIRLCAQDVVFVVRSIVIIIGGGGDRGGKVSMRAENGERRTQFET